MHLPVFKNLGSDFILFTQKGCDKKDERALPLSLGMIQTNGF